MDLGCDLMAMAVFNCVASCHHIWLCWAICACVLVSVRLRNPRWILLCPQDLERSNTSPQQIVGLQGEHNEGMQTCWWQPSTRPQKIKS